MGLDPELKQAETVTNHPNNTSARSQLLTASPSRVASEKRTPGDGLHLHNPFLPLPQPYNVQPRARNSAPGADGLSAAEVRLLT